MVILWCASQAQKGFWYNWGAADNLILLFVVFVAVAGYQALG